jgi:Lar family restriction alleviation protein
MEKLKPCPFCGNDAAQSYTKLQSSRCPDVAWYGVVTCIACGAKIESWSGYESQIKAKEEATKLWNRRVESVSK